jgi:hypothetical protein
MTRKKGNIEVRFIDPIRTGAGLGSRTSRGVLKGMWLRGGGARFERAMDMQTWVSSVPADGAVTVKQAAALLFVTPMTVHRWVTDGWVKALPTKKQSQICIPLVELQRLAVERGLFVGVGK